MILIDSSVWIDHIRQADPALGALLDRDQVLTHAAVIGEVALGSLKDRALIVAHLRALPRTAAAAADEILGLIESAGLHGRGIGYVDAGLIASALLTPGTRIWTHDRRLASVCADAGLGYNPPVN